jgi:hypothetical protein
VHSVITPLVAAEQARRLRETASVRTPKRRATAPVRTQRALVIASLLARPNRRQQDRA